nr:CMF_HP1_G0048130.mRNA.1.CDS.1 [Saccharomyces cerevisiae]
MVVSVRCCYHQLSIAQGPAGRSKKKLYFPHERWCILGEYCQRCYLCRKMPRQSSLVNWLATVVMSGISNQHQKTIPEDHGQYDHGKRNDCSYQWQVSDAQKRYAQGVKNILNSYFSKSLIIIQDIIVQNGSYATRAYGQKK